MGNRIIKESICTSDSIDGLSWFEEVFFYRLIVNCDDYGRFDARPAVLRARLFPLKDITNKQIEAALSKLAKAGMVRVYEYDRQPYLQLENWGKHQTVRNRRSKYPEPPATECNYMQMNADVCNCASNPIQSVSVSLSESVSESVSEHTGADAPDANAGPPKIESLQDRRFAEFWDLYPKKQGKGAAEKAYRKISPDRDLHMAILRAVTLQKQSSQWRKDGGQYIPNPATWLNQRRWEDEVQTGRPQSTGNVFLDILRQEEAANDEG